MEAGLQGRIQELDRSRRELLDEAAALPETVLRAKPTTGGWSILEIVEHLVLAERAILLDLPDPATLLHRPRGFKARCLYLLVLCILAWRIPVKVPSRRMQPAGGRTLAELRAQWDETLAWLAAYAAGLNPTRPQPAVFRHPIAGPLTLDQALRMDLLHLEIHRQQIRRLRTGGA